MKDILTRLLFLAFLTVIIVPFNNCGQEVTSADSSSLGASLPFAFESQMDQIAYMSCSDITDTNSHFTFKAGAYQSGNGLRLRSAFRTAVNGYSTSDVISALEYSGTNYGTHQQLAIRQTLALQNILNSTIGNYLTSLSEENIVKSLSLTSANYVTTLSYQPTNYQSLEVQTAYNGGTTESYAQTIRSYMTSAVLAATFSDGTSTAAAAPTANSSSSVYGRGYNLTFKTPTAVTSMPAKVLSAITETNLETGQTVTASWSCPSTYMLKIVRYQDRGVNAGSTCSNANFDDVIGSDSAAYNRVRQMLSSTYWAVDMTNGCIVAKSSATSGTCYPSSVAAGKINYTTTGSCLPGSNTCAHYLSLCIRN